jgi:coenzyme F420-dependent glucose-6-phosphate dehydrogenase
MKGPTISYQASHEQFSPAELLKLAIMAEEAGFDAINSSDHFKPWSVRQGHSGFSFAWLGAAMQATTLPFSMVCTPGYRYHPAVVAQALATLADMFPGRFTVALGSGEAVNEKITGERWPSKEERNERLGESVDVIRKMLAGEIVNYYGHIKVEDASLYSLPQKLPPIYGAAISTKTAEWVGSWADGLLTVSQQPEKMQQVIEAFHKGGGKGKPMTVKVDLSYARTEEEALMGAHDQWRNNIFDSAALADISKVAHFDEMARFVKPDDLREFVYISSDLQQQAEWLQQYIHLGFDNIILHNVNRGQEVFIRDFGKEILPHL